MILLLIKKWWSGRNKPQGDGDSASLEDDIARIQAGDETLRNDVLQRYQPFVAKTASKFCKRYVNPETDDEFSIALLAFNEAMEHWKPDAGRSFIGFAETVIRRRLTDYVRKEQRTAGQIPQSAFLQEDEEGETFDPIDARRSAEMHLQERERDERRLEIEGLNAQLADFGISFTDLVEGSPKHEDSRKMLIGIGWMLSRDRDLSEVLLLKKSLPLKELTERASVSRKTLERGRKYIIAVALIHMGQYPHLQSFVAPPAERAISAESQQMRGWGG